MRRADDLPKGGLSERQKAEIRAAALSAYVHRCSGSSNLDDIPPARRAISCAQATDVFSDVIDSGEHKWMPELLGRCLSQMYVAGYWPDKEDPRWDRLIRLAVYANTLKKDEAQFGDKDRPRARDKIVERAERFYSASSQTWLERFQEDKALIGATEGDRRIALPTQVTHRGSEFNVVKQVYFRVPLKDVADLINPENWTQLAPYFHETTRVDPPEDHGLRGRNGGAPAISWHGYLREIFKVSFMGFTTQTYSQYLQIDYTVTEDVVRSDYSLYYEDDRKILKNEGYFEGRKVAGHAGWMLLTMIKTLQLASPFDAFLAPAVMGLFLEQEAGGFRRFLP